jgi:two-component system, OmpR family, phosphate regulon response regulator PhoB
VQRLLVAEDDPDIRELVLFKLRAAGFDVTTAVDGREALTRALEEPPDLVLLDVMMPGLSGLEVCAALREDDATARIPIILLTAKAQEADVTSGLGVGADDYVVKPFSPRELLTRVQAVLARSRR